MININKEIRALLDCAIGQNLISERDRVYGLNSILGVLNLDSYKEVEDDQSVDRPIEDILENFRKWAVENKRVEDDSIDSLDLFDTRLMASICKMPSQIEGEFWEQYSLSPDRATDYFYNFAKKVNYIREKRISKDIGWKYKSEYGDLDITINMSKPEKDPRAIARARNVKSSNYPKCLLCKENEAYGGRINHPARGNHRLIQIDLAGEEWFFQYSPYVYYNEHCIVLKGKHEPMKINDKTFKRLLDFVKVFPHYVIGSNAGLPIVGGSILSHDHFQGGCYTFAIANAREENHLQLKEGIESSSLHWPMTTIRIKGSSIGKLVKAAYEILVKWEAYTDKSVGIISETKGEPHNAITPICRFRNGLYELDLVLRNNRTTEERPYGLFHPREEYHNIKKENIGLIEAMGLAVLPSRLKREMEDLKKYLIEGRLEGIKERTDLSKHYHLASKVYDKYKSNGGNIDELLENEIGSTFLKILKDAGVFKDSQEGRIAFKKCRQALFSNLI